MFLRTPYCVICTKADIQEKTEKKKEMEHQCHSNTVSRKRNNYVVLFSCGCAIVERKKIKENMESA